MSYFVDGKRYADYFPYRFAIYHYCGTGPSDCADCAYHGKVGGIFMGYCDDCSRYVYNGSRGPGMNKYSGVDIYRQIDNNSEFFKGDFFRVNTKISKKYIIFIILFVVLSSIWMFNNGLFLKGRTPK
jgi:hypothetical protein